MSIISIDENNFVILQSVRRLAVLLYYFINYTTSLITIVQFQSTGLISLLSLRRLSWYFVQQISLVYR